MSSQSLTDQLGWCITTMEQLNKVGEELNYSANLYNDIVGQLDNAGYMAEMLKDIQFMNADFQEALNGLKKHIYYDHMVYTESQIKQVQVVLKKFS